MKLNFKGTGFDNFFLEIDADCKTVADLKAKTAEQCKLGAGQQKIFLKGRLLNDADELAAKKVVEGATLMIVKGGVEKGTDIAEEHKKKAEEQKKKKETVA